MRRYGAFCFCRSAKRPRTRRRCLHIQNVASNLPSVHSSCGCRVAAIMPKGGFKHIMLAVFLLVPQLQTFSPLFHFLHFPPVLVVLCSNPPSFFSIGWIIPLHFPSHSAIVVIELHWVT